MERISIRGTNLEVLCSFELIITTSIMQSADESEREKGTAITSRRVCEKPPGAKVRISFKSAATRSSSVVSLWQGLQGKEELLA